MSQLGNKIGGAFSTKVYPNLNDPKVAQRMRDGIAELKNCYLGQFWPWVLNGEVFGCGTSRYTTHDPSHPETIIAYFSKFDSRSCKLDEPLLRIREAGRRFFLTVPWPKRVELLQMISEVAKERFWLLCAAKAYESGQSVGEQIGETDEEVDFPLANAWYLERLHSEERVATPAFAGDISGFRYVPHGTFLNVCPFNFPGAIPMDMATKALAMGNAFIEKSSPKSSLSGYLMCETIKIAFERMGIDWRGVVNYAPGGADVVDAMLSSKWVAGMSFTGSSAVLNSIVEKHGSLLRPMWRGKARLAIGSAETSGVNFFIVAQDANSDHASTECVKAFTGRSGQKCSSARLVFVQRDACAKEFLLELTHKVRDLKYGDVKHGALVGPMATADDVLRLGKQVRRATCIDGWAKIHFQMPIATSGAFDFSPTILVADLAEMNEYDREQMLETEFFGPVTTVVIYDHMNQVEQCADETRFALTGSIFTDDVKTLVNVINFMPAGNVYWNRKCTGALVETECFGGLRSASSPSGIKGMLAFGLFASNPSISGFYPTTAQSRMERAEYSRALREIGFVFSKY